MGRWWEEDVRVAGTGCEGGEERMGEWLGEGGRVVGRMGGW